MHDENQTSRDDMCEAAQGSPNDLTTEREVHLGLRATSYVRATCTHSIDCTVLAAWDKCQADLGGR